MTYGLLIAPWPGWGTVYGRFFRGLAGAVFAREQGPAIVRFRPAENPPRPVIDTEIVLADRTQIDATGHGPANILGLDTRGVAWVPTALMLALASATPLPWSRQWRVQLLGVLLVHGYLMVVVGGYLWNQSAGLVPVSFIPFWPPLGEFLEETLVTQMGPSFAVPVLLWLLALTAVSCCPPKTSLRSKAIK